jgi:hypothetical protein
MQKDRTARSPIRTLVTSATLVIVVALFIGGLSLVVASSARYGGLDNVLVLVRAKLSGHRSNPAFVPTPIAVNGSGLSDLSPVASSTPTPTSTLSPKAGVLRTKSAEDIAPTATLTATPAHRPTAPSVELTGCNHMWQTWNNCGPATLAMALSYFGLELDQTDIEPEVRPNPEDKHAGAEEMAAFARERGFETLLRVNGDAHRLRLLLSNDLPVMVATWVEEEEGDGLGHYRLLTGYDHEAQEWIVYDSYISTGVDPDEPYRGIRLTYEEMDQGWMVYNRLHLIIYPPEKQAVVRSILGPDYDEEVMWRRALQASQEAVKERPEDPFAWFNLGTSLVAAEAFERAARAYDQARTIGLPWRMLWYQFGPFEAYYHAGRYEELISLARATLDVTEHIEEVHYWLGMGLLETGDVAGARRAFRRALKQRPDYAKAAEALARTRE